MLFFKRGIMNIKNVLNNISQEKKMFFIFLIINIIVWAGLGLIRVVLPTDSLEGIFWGSLHDLGTPKHPPLAGWLTYIVYSVFKCDLSVYLLCVTFISVGMYFIYKLGKIFLDEKCAILSAVVMEGCWAYSYVTSYYGFNPDVVLLGLLPILTYLGYKCLNENKKTDWIILGIITGICFLNKYQTALIILPLALWAVIFKREIFKNVYFYLSIIIAFFIFLPHLLWLVKYEFFPLLYFEGELSSNSWLNHITAPVYFLIMQLGAIAGTLVIFLILKWKQKSSLKINFISDSKTWFLLLIGLVPLIIHLCMGFCAGGTMRPRWGFEFLYLTGIMLFYFLPVKELSKDDIKFTFKLAYCVMAIIFIVMATLLSVEKNYRSRYPVAQIHNDLLKIWSDKYDTPLKYIGGYIEWTLPLTIYGDTHPTCILDTNNYKNPWIDNDDLKKSGFIILDRNIEEIKDHFKKECNYLKNMPNPVEYKFKLTNAFGQEREYTIYYLIIPPEK